jgi:hypothetical protein
MRRMRCALPRTSQRAPCRYSSTGRIGAVLRQPQAVQAHGSAGLAERKSIHTSSMPSAAARPPHQVRSLGWKIHSRCCSSSVAQPLFGELLKIEGKAPNHDHVPYQGSAPAMQDLLGGHIESVFDPITTNVATLKAGSLRALAVSTPKRLPALPNIPTFAELGFPSSPARSGWACRRPRACRRPSRRS